jgi:diadenylate cyclase
VRERLTQFLEMVGKRDLVEIAILAVVIYALLSLLGRARGAGMVRGLALIVVGLFLFGQVVIASFDMTELAKVFDYLLTTVLVGMVIIFQPELRRGLTVLGRSRLLRYFVTYEHPIADRLADAAVALSRECIGALVAIQREITLDSYVETGERIDAEISTALLCTIFTPRSPLHDGAVILANGRIVAAACQLPLSEPTETTPAHVGMRHRAALGMSEETDAILLVVSEETGRISLALGGRLEAVPRENLSRRLADLLSGPVEEPLPLARAA